ncbi:MAG: CDGSH iron-sulfur domain-containing protein [Kangiellaceae bacterium]|nr:CDGSH iron-sulfur domain-containing protein [Kangiellaceae bacterium]MCW8998187.1 CDGSH iron-sulfur domain-containing protein [Kangiellaceae bacterium]MCW9015321.1 CDGSH iron-sulfur domain-containing protein [Kangiellaceae bacterium]
MKHSLRILPRETKTRIYRKPTGPIVVSGDVLLTDENGEQLKHSEKFSLCGCGKSNNLPFCDGNHKKQPPAANQ